MWGLAFYPLEETTCIDHIISLIPEVWVDKTRLTPPIFLLTWMCQARKVCSHVFVCQGYLHWLFLLFVICFRNCSDSLLFALGIVPTVCYFLDFTFIPCDLEVTFSQFMWLCSFDTGFCVFCVVFRLYVSPGVINYLLENWLTKCDLLRWYVNYTITVVGDGANLSVYSLDQ